MAAYTCDHLDSIVTGWGKPATLFDDFPPAGGGMYSYDIILVTEDDDDLGLGAEVAQSLGLHVGTAFEDSYVLAPDNDADFPPDGTVWVTTFDTEAIEAGATPSGHWSVD